MEREFLFNYRFDGSDWGISIFATNPDEAREKIKAVGMARYQGEVQARIHLPGSSIVARLLHVLRGNNERR